MTLTPLKLPLYLSMEVLVYAVLLDYLTIMPRYFKHSWMKMYSHGFAAILFFVLGILNETSNNKQTWNTIKDNKWNLYYSLAFLNLYLLLAIQLSTIM